MHRYSSESPVESVKLGGYKAVKVVIAKPLLFFIAMNNCQTEFNCHQVIQY